MGNDFIKDPAKHHVRPPECEETRPPDPPQGSFNQVSRSTWGASGVPSYVNMYIIIFPDNSQRNCWDVGSTVLLTHDGGGDTQAIAQMVQYTLAAYNADPDRVYIMGGSSGAMMTQAMLAVYPDIFKAGSARTGVLRFLQNVSKPVMLQIHP